MPETDLIAIRDEVSEFIRKQRVPTSLRIKDLEIVFDENQDDIKTIRLEKLETSDKGVYALTGRSGSGKSTIFNAITEFQNLTSGEIEFVNDGETTPRVYYFTQDSEIFSRNFVLNIVLSNLPLVTYIANSRYNEEVKFVYLKILIYNSLKKALLYEKALETGVYNSIENLSGGEKQRLLFARLFFSNCDIVLLDESFANLDQ